jgi:hypothetical protein
VGDKFKTVKRTYPDNSFTSISTEIIYEIIKATDTVISLRPVGTEDKPITRKPIKTNSGKWRFSIDNTYDNQFYFNDTGDEDA